MRCPSFCFALCLLLSCLPPTPVWAKPAAEPAAADVSSPLGQLAALLKQQDYNAAWPLATSLQGEYEGDPQFDYLFGVAARGAGQLHQAVFALERALQAAPQSADIRLALAVSYYELGNHPAAEREFKQLDLVALPARNRSLVQAYLLRIEQRRDIADGYWQNWLQLSAGTDSNPNSGVDDEFLLIPVLGEVRLFGQSLAKDSSFYEWQGQLNWTLPRDQHSAFYLSAGLLHGEYSEDLVFSRTYASALAGYQTRWQGYQLAAELFYRPIRLDGDAYLDYQGLKTSVSHALGAGWQAGVDLTAAQQAYDRLPALDKQQWLVESWLSLEHGRSLHKFQLRYGVDDSDQRRTDFNSRDFYGLGYRWQLTLDERWQSSLTLDYLKGEYDAVHPLFRQVRDDSYYRAELELNYSLSPQWRLLTSLSHLRNDSNISLYQYRRTRGWLGARYAF